MNDRTVAHTPPMTKDAALHAWEREMDSKGAPAFTREKDGSVSVGSHSPLAKDFRSGNESFRKLLEIF